MVTKAKDGGVLSVDLASRRYKDFGIAFLPGDSRAPEFPKPGVLGLEGTPDPEACAAALTEFCRETNTRVLLLDGPQGWRMPGSSIENMRLCERVLNTPAKTGIPGHTKPGTYLAYTQFSVDLFHHLRLDHGWSLLNRNWHRRRRTRWAIETFPSSAWQLLGLPRLPGKSRAKRADLDRWSRLLSQVSGYEFPAKLSHDQLQAAVVLPLGRAVLEGDIERVFLAGVEPFLSEDGEVLEGLIACPRWPEI